MGNLVGAMTLSERKISDEPEPKMEIERQKSRELIFKGKLDPIASAISKALDDPDSSPLSTKKRKSFQESEI